MKNRFGKLFAVSIASAAVLSAGVFAGELTDLAVEDVAQMVEFTFDAETTEYAFDVVEDLYAIKFTPTVSEGTVTVSAEGLDGLLTMLNEDGTDSADEALVKQPTLEVADGQSFYLSLTEKRLAAISESDVAAGKNAVGLEEDQDYTVTIEGSEKTYVIHIHRPNSEYLASQFELNKWNVGTEEAPEMQDYWLYVPESYDGSEPYPVYLMLHGGGQRSNNSKDILYRYMMATAPVKYGKDVIIIAPQANNDTLDSDNAGWNSADMSLTKFGLGAMAILDNVKANYNVDESRIYVGGCSMGGMGTAAFLYNYPDVFAAGVVDCGGSRDAELAEKFAKALKDMDVDLMIAHAKADPVVPFTNSENMMAALDAEGVPYSTTFYEEDAFFRPTAHFSWTPFFDNEANLDWLFSQVKGE